jgi:hypothetical protein
MTAPGSRIWLLSPILFSYWPPLLILFSHWPTQNKDPHGLQDEDEEEEEEDVSSVPPLVLTPQHKGAIRTIRKPHANHVKILKTKTLKGHMPFVGSDLEFVLFYS